MNNLNEKLCNLMLFTFMVGDRLYGIQTVLIAKPFQPPQNCVPRSVQELNGISWRAIRVLTHNFKLHSPMPRSAKCNAASVHQLFKPSVTYYPLVLESASPREMFRG